MSIDVTESTIESSSWWARREAVDGYREPTWHVHDKVYEAEFYIRDLEHAEETIKVLQAIASSMRTNEPT